MDYSEVGIDVKKFIKKHPISGVASDCFEVAIPKSFYHAELEKIEVKYIKREVSSRRYLSRKQKNRLQKSYAPAIQLKANRFGLM